MTDKPKSEQPKKPLDEVITVPGGFQIIDNRTPEQKKWRKLVIGRCGHIKRRLRRKEPLTGDLLKFALDLVEPDPKNQDEFAQFGRRMATKLKHGMPLDDYELHIMEEIFLLNARLGV